MKQSKYFHFTILRRIVNRINRQSENHRSVMSLSRDVTHRKHSAEKFPSGPQTPEVGIPFDRDEVRAHSTCYPHGHYNVTEVFLSTKPLYDILGCNTKRIPRWKEYNYQKTWSQMEH